MALKGHGTRRSPMPLCVPGPVVCNQCWRRTDADLLPLNHVRFDPDRHELLEQLEVLPEAVPVGL